LGGLLELFFNADPYNLDLKIMPNIG